LQFEIDGGTRDIKDRSWAKHMRVLHGSQQQMQHFRIAFSNPANHNCKCSRPFKAALERRKNGAKTNAASANRHRIRMLGGTLETASLTTRKVLAHKKVAACNANAPNQVLERNRKRSSTFAADCWGRIRKLTPNQTGFITLKKGCHLCVTNQ
jgi:hypothetical protein